VHRRRREEKSRETLQGVGNLRTLELRSAPFLIAGHVGPRSKFLAGEFLDKMSGKAGGSQVVGGRFSNNRQVRNRIRLFLPMPCVTDEVKLAQSIDIFCNARIVRKPILTRHVVPSTQIMIAWAIAGRLPCRHRMQGKRPQ
jgi:hypothetical protein